MEQEKKEWSSIACFVSKGAKFDVNKVATENQNFESCTFPVTLIKKTFKGNNYVNLFVQTTNPADIDKILNKDIKEYSNLHVRGYWDSYEKDGKTYWTLKTGKDPITYVSSAESLKKENLKLGSKKVVYGGVTNIRFFRSSDEIAGSQRNAAIQIIAEGTDKEGKRESINCKVSDPTLVENIQAHVKAGTSVIVEGVIKEDEFVATDGEKKKSIYLDVEKFSYAARPDWVFNKISPSSTPEKQIEDVNEKYSEPTI